MKRASMSFFYSSLPHDFGLCEPSDQLVTIMISFVQIYKEEKKQENVFLR